MKVNKSLTNPKGGTEILFDGLSSRIDLSQINLIVSKTEKKYISNTKPNVLWHHVNYDHKESLGLADPNFVDKLDAIVFVSHWQHEQYRKRAGLPGEKCYVIHNCVNQEQSIDKPKDIKIIYNAMPYRGLQLLINAYQLMKHHVPLTIISGTRVYGKNYEKIVGDKFEAIYQQLSNLKIKHYKYLPNDKVLEELQSHHIFAYPCIIEETSCLSAIEALSYGLKVVTTNYGALPETCSVFADYVPLGEESEFTIRYAKALDNAVENYYYNNFQVEFYKKYYSWEARIPEWQKLIEHLCNENYIT